MERSLSQNLYRNVQVIAEAALPYCADHILHDEDVGTESMRYATYREAARKRMKALVSLLPTHDYALHQQCFSRRLGGYKDKSFYQMWNIFLSPPEPPKYLVTSHFDHAGGCGAVDNASGMAVMAAVAHRIANMRNDVGFCCFDGEEMGLSGSKHFMSKDYSALRQNLRAVYNVDSIGRGRLVNACRPDRYDGASRVMFAANLPSVTLMENQTDADVFHYRYIPASTLTTLYSGVLHDIVPRSGLYHVHAYRHPVNVCNSKNDTMKAIDPENLEKAVDILLETINGQR